MSENQDKKYFCPNCNEPILNTDELDYACKEDHYENEQSETSQEKFKVSEVFDKSKIPDCQACKILPGGKISRYKYPFKFVKCPVCGQLIPLAIFNPKVEVFRICIAGTTHSGKTCYKSRLNMLIKSQEGGLKPAFLEYPKSDITVLEQGKELPDPTDSIKGPDGNLSPEYLGFKTSDGRIVLLIIYDIAGEDYRDFQISSDNEETNIKFRAWKKFVTKSDAVFFLLDPKQSFYNHLDIDEKQLNDNKQTGAEQVATIDVIHAILTDINEAAFADDEESISKCTKIAYIYSKLDDSDIQKKLKKINDANVKEFKKEELLWDSDGELIYSLGNEGELADPSSILFDFAKENDPRFASISDKSETSFVSRYFIVSALGIDAEIDGAILKKLGKQFRVLDPILWIIGKGEK